MTDVVVIHTDDFAAGVNGFFTSLGWTYLAHRYPVPVQGKLLRLLTVSGLDPWEWERSALKLVQAAPRDGAVLSLIARRGGDVDADTLRAAIAEIWAYAVEEGASVGKPPAFPFYLTGYGYSHAAYLTDLEVVYGPDIAPDYMTAWPDTPAALQKSLVQPVLLRQAVAIMGATAGAIEQLIARGEGYDNGD